MTRRLCLIRRARTNKVAKVVKSATAELWAGTTVSTGANFSVPTIPFSGQQHQDDGAGLFT